MQTILRHIVTSALVLIITASAFGAGIELRLKDGTRWRGNVGDTVTLTLLEQGVALPFVGRIVEAKDLYLVVDGKLAGQAQKKTIFKSDIIAITTGTPAAGAPAAGAQSAGSAATPAAAAATAETPSAAPAGETASVDGKIVEPGMPPGCWKDPKTGYWVAPKQGVFVLPLEGMVGLDICHQEIEMVSDYADKFGPGQIIVLLINTNGGMVVEAEDLDETIQKVQKKHRVVAWVRKAISAGCVLAMGCQEIYFMTEGTAGSVTTLAGGPSMPEGPELDKQIEALVATCKRNGHSEHIARAMKLNRFLCSYTKDPVTGEVTWYGDKSGKVLLSDENSNLCFNSSNALDCGFSDGTADTGEQLAKLLNLPEWYEISNYSRKVGEDWVENTERAQKEMKLIQARLDYKGTSSGDPAVVIGTRIGLLEELKSWMRRAPHVARNPDAIRRIDLQIQELRKQLADIKKAQRQ